MDAGCFCTHTHTHTRMSYAYESMKYMDIYGYACSMYLRISDCMALYVCVQMHLYHNPLDSFN